MNGDKARLFSLSGAPVIHHEKTVQAVEAADASTDAPILWKHISETVGAPELVLHERRSELVHIDVHLIPPQPEQPFNVLVTSGMSDKPMRAPEKHSNLRYAELSIALPADWPLTVEDLQDEKNYWPIRMLKKIARFPHVHDTWVWKSHTIENGNPSAPFHDSTFLSVSLLAPPIGLLNDFEICHCSPEKEVHFFSIIPLYKEEMQLKLRLGMGPLVEAFQRQGITMLIDPMRQNVAL